MKHDLKKVFLAAILVVSFGAGSFVAKAEEGNIASVQQTKGRIVTGVITDATDGSPIVGANVMLENSKTGVITDLDGKYSIRVNNNRDVLIITYIGYKKREVPVEDLGVINIQLHSDNELLDEVVVVGQGTQKKVSVTGSISAIKGAELRTTSSSLSNGMAGKLAGVITTATSGEPGSGSDFYIRGISTFGGVATPLIMLDDVEISAGDLNNIPAETIESFSILKDASATAIYGARGANGVMLITTKRGAENTKARINVTIENTFNSPMKFPDFVDGATWMELYNEALLTRHPNRDKYYSDEVIAATRRGDNPYVYPSVDWVDLMFKNMAMNQRANINISGGGSRVTYYMSLNVNHDTGLLDSPKIYSWNNNINNLTYNFQNNISYKISDNTKIDLNINAQIANKKGPSFKTEDLFQMALSTDPVTYPAFYPAQEGDMHVRFGNQYHNGTTVGDNPYAYMSSSFKQTDASTLNISLRINQKLDFITKGLSVNGLINFKNWASTYYTRTIDPYYYHLKSYDEDTQAYDYDLLKKGTDYISQSGISRSGDRTIALQFQLNYQRQFGLNHVGGMLMYMQRDYKSEVLPNRNQGFSGRFTYDFDHRYLAEFNFGYNGTERLPEGDRFEFFPAISLGWVISNEKFFESARETVDNLKLRASYGLVGSDQFHKDAPHFLYRDNVSLSSVGFTAGADWNNTKKGPNITAYQVLNPRWERSKKLDIGIDATLFRDWSITADYFFEKRTDILMRRASFPQLIGFGSYSPWNNSGAVDNWGIEFSTNYRKNIGKDWSIDFRGNFTYTENKYTSKDEPTRNYPWEVETGTPLAATWGYIADGLFESQDEIDNHAVQSFGSTPMPGDIKYRDLNGDNKIDHQDRCMISEYGRTPRIQYGFGLNIVYKNFDLGVFFNGSAMRKIMLGGIHPFLKSPLNADHNMFKFIADDHWTEANPNPDAKYPRLGLVQEETKNNYESSTYWMRNGNFLRFKTLELGYSFKYGRIFVNGDNLAVFSPFKEWDPELYWYKYPLQRTISIGAQLKF